jgi:hypothetical protein
MRSGRANVSEPWYTQRPRCHPDRAFTRSSKRRWAVVQVQVHGIMRSDAHAIGARTDVSVCVNYNVRGSAHSKPEIPNRRRAARGHVHGAKYADCGLHGWRCSRQ